MINRLNGWGTCIIIMLLLMTAKGLYANYGVLYVSPNGSNSNPGTASLPLKTIQKAADMAMPGDTILVMEGVYRERVAPPRGGVASQPIVYKAEPGKQVYIKGSDIWSPQWTSQNSQVFYAVPDESLFNDDSYVDNKNPFKVPVSSTPYNTNGKPEVERGFGGDPNLILTIGQVFVDSKLYVQKGYLNQVTTTPDSWYYDRESGAIYIHFASGNPSGHTVEISTRRRIFAPHKRQLGYIVVEGFILEHCGNQYPTNFWEVEHPEWQQAGALGTRSGHHWTIRNNTIRFAHGIGLDCGNEGNRNVDLETGDNGPATGAGYHIIDSNFITDNGGAGTAAYGPTNVTFTNNVVERNNNLNFNGQKRWESAGVKFHSSHRSVFAKNLIRNNYGKWGLWLDGGSGDNTRVYANLIIGHEVGFDLEIGSAYADKLLLDNNVFINNQTAIASRESGGITVSNNLILNSSAYGVHSTINTTRTGDWSAAYQYYYNNIFVDAPKPIDITAPDFYKSEYRRFGYNVYKGDSTVARFRIHPGNLLNFIDWKDKWRVYNAESYWDRTSFVTNDISYVLNETTLELTLTVDFDLRGMNMFRHTKLDKDYNGLPIPTNCTGIVGPFQNLIRGTNTFLLWNGL